MTGINHFVSSSDGEAIAEPLYRELDNAKLFTFKPQSYFSIHPLEADTRSDRARTRQRRLTSRYNFLSKITRSDRARTRQPRLTSRYILLVFAKQTKHSKWQVSITLSVRVMERRQPRHCIENSTTPSYFSIHFACFFKTNKTLEVTSIILSVRVISWDSKEISWNRIENSTSLSYFSIHPLEADTRSDIEATLCQFEPAYQGTQAGDFMGFERNLMKSYRELDNPVLLLDTFCLFLLNKQNTRSDRHKSLCQFEWFHGIRKKSHEIVSRTRLTTHD